MAKPKRKQSRGSVGSGSGSTLSYSPGMIAGMEARMAKTEARWANLSGPVSIRQMSSEELREYRRQLAERQRNKRR